ncbi:MAG: T9SS type A sorting domain-containing protein [Bacteroidales bacterium]|nr:T9SS type A sorting domain-containing protein [Bacteroidales bacterium]
MKKNRLLLLTLLMAVLANLANLANAQDTTLAAFDDGVFIWNSWSGAGVDIIANPDYMFNNTDSVALLDQTGGAWDGFATWKDDSYLSADVVAISVDVYFKNTGGTIQLMCDNSISAGADFTASTTVDANTWTTVKFDISGSAQDYKQIAFQSSVADSLLLDNIVLVAAVPDDPTNLIAGGNMEYSDPWNFYMNTVDAPHNYGSHTFNYTADTCEYGENGSYYVSFWGQSATFLWQPVTLKPNHYYEFTGAFKNISAEALNSTWMELILKKTSPGVGEVTFAGAGEFGFGDNTWNGAERLDADTTYQDYMSFTGADTNLFLLPADAPAQYYAVVKLGSWQATGDITEPKAEFIIDNISLVDMGVNTTFVIDQVVDGEVTDAADLTATADVTWDADSIYMTIDIVDDVMHIGEANIYEGDNIEVYFDMDNSKNPLWPRNSGWPNTSYDENDYQFRLTPEVDWDSVNTIGGVRQVYAATADGYTFGLSICWDSLLVDFAAVEGTEIGFDFVVSDNDGDYRNQISWAAPNTMPWNDASLLGTVKLDEGMSLLPIFDTEAPAAPVATADVVDTVVTVTWDAVADNIAVLTYEVLVDGDVVNERFAQAETGTFTATVHLSPGTYSITVAAIDNSGNKATSEAVEVIIDEVSVNNLKAHSFAVRPNPSDGMVYINSKTTSEASLTVYTLSGQLVANHTFVSDFVLDMSDVKAGMYILRIESEGTLDVQRLVIE